MKNIEKYRDDILNYKKNNFCGDFIKPVILERYRINCCRISCEHCHIIRGIWLNEEYKEPERPELTAEELENLPVDTLLEVWRDGGEECTRLRYFAKYEDNTIYCWDHGRTSKTTEHTNAWQHARLAEAE